MIRCLVLLPITPIGESSSIAVILDHLAVEFLVDNLPENIVDVCHLLVPPAARDLHASRWALRPSSALICVVFIFHPVYAPRALLRRRRHDRSPQFPLNVCQLMRSSP